MEIIFATICDSWVKRGWASWQRNNDEYRLVVEDWEPIREWRTRLRSTLTPMTVRCTQCGEETKITLAFFCPYCKALLCPECTADMHDWYYNPGEDEILIGICPMCDADVSDDVYLQEYACGGLLGDDL